MTEPGLLPGQGTEGSVEQALRESEARYRLLLSNWAQAMWETNAEGVVVTDSPSWRAYTGQTLDEWLGYGWLNAIHPDDRAFAERQWREAIAARRFADAEFRLRAPDGGWRWTNVRAAPVLDATGSIEKWVGMNIDIDARKQAEAMLRASEEKFRTLFEGLDEGLSIQELVFDGAGRVIDWIYREANSAFESQGGFPNPYGKRGSEVVPNVDQQVLDLMDRVARTGEPERSESHITDIDRHIRFQTSRVGGAGSRLLAVVFQDITDQRRAEVVLRESEERQAFLLKLSDALRAEPDADAVANRAINMLSDQLRLDRCYITYYRPADDAADFPYQIGNDTVPPLPATVRLSDFPDAYQQVLEKTYVIDDDFERRGLSEIERANSNALGMRAMLASTVRKGAKVPLASMVAVSSQPRHWKPGEIALIEETAERTWAAIAHARTDTALRESEERYRTLFESIDEGFTIMEAIRDGSGRVVDVIYRQANRAWERQIGFEIELGRKASELFSYRPEDAPWIETWNQVLDTGESYHGEQYVAAGDRWYNVHFSRIGTAGSDLIAAVFDDITERKRAEMVLRESEERQAFLLKLSDVVRPLAEPAEIQGETTRLLRERLSAGWCYYVDWDLDRKIGRVLRDSASEGLPSLTGAHDVSDALEFLELQATGEVLTARDYANYEQLSTRIRENFTGLGFRSMMAAPLVKQGRLIASLLVGDTEIRGWTKSEASLLAEVAERTWAAVERARAETALRESEERFRSLFESMDEAYAVVEVLKDETGAWADFRFINANPAFMVHTNMPYPVGKTATELLGSPNPRWTELYGQVLDSGETLRVEESEGTLGITFDLNIFTLDREHNRVAVLFTNITERKRNEEALKWSEERFRALVTAGTLSIYRMSPDWGLMYQLDSRTLADTAEPIEDWVEKYIPPDDLPAVRTAIDTAIRTKSLFELEHRVWAADGGIAWVMSRAVPLLGKDGEIVEWFGAGTIVTERRQAEEARNESELRLRRIVESATDYAIFATDPAGIITDWMPGAAAVFGWSASEAIGQPAGMTFVPEDRAAHEPEKEFAEAGREGLAPNVRWHLRKDGQRVFIEGTVTPLTDGSGTLRGFLKIGQDVTERHLADERQRLLLAELQHRVRNTLGVIRSITRRTALNSDDVDEMAAHLEGRIEAFARVQAMVTRDPDAGVDLAALVEDELVAHAARENDRRTIDGPEIRLAPKIAEMFSLAVHELATNAVKYGALANDRGRLAIRWSKDGDVLRFVWEESGLTSVPEKPEREGFGMELLTRALPYELTAEVRLEFRPQGVCFTLDMPLQP